MTIDWNVLNHEAVKRNCEVTAKAVASKNRGVIEYDDLLQEAYILCATNPEHVNGYVDDDNIGFLNRWLWLKLTTVAETYARKSRNDISLEQLVAARGDW